jgi:ActD protein
MAERELGLLAEFATADALLDAAKAARRAGYRRLDAFSPYPVEGMAEALAIGDHRIGWLACFGGAFGIAVTLALQLFVNWDYPIEVGGRPLVALPAFFVVDFELMILFAVLFAIGGMLVLNRLPKLHHPLFGTPRFSLASDDRFFLYVEAGDPKFDDETTRAFLGGLGAWTIETVRG